MKMNDAIKSWGTYIGKQIGFRLPINRKVSRLLELLSRVTTDGHVIHAELISLLPNKSIVKANLGSLRGCPRGYAALCQG